MNCLPELGRESRSKTPDTEKHSHQDRSWQSYGIASGDKSITSVRLHSDREHHIHVGSRICRANVEEYNYDFHVLRRQKNGIPLPKISLENGMYPMPADCGTIDGTHEAIRCPPNSSSLSQGLLLRSVHGGGGCEPDIFVDGRGSFTWSWRVIRA